MHIVILPFGSIPSDNQTLPVHLIAHYSVVHKIQTECYRLLSDNPKILGDLQVKIHYLMIDEYQDTNYIQEQIIFMLGEKHGNICVVGDDDQGLYRFRGATIRNILEFPHKFEEGACKIIPLTVNYRSNSDIVDFYNEWISTTDGAKFKFEWGNFRYDKHIVPYKHSDTGKSAPRYWSFTRQVRYRPWRVWRKK